MKRGLLIICIALLSFTTSKEPIERLGVKGPLQFNETSFDFSWSNHPNEFYYVQEYLPKGETLENFNQMLTLHVFDKKVTTEEAMKQKGRELELRKKTDKVCNYEVNESPDGKEFIVDCLLSQSKGDKLEIVEFNIYRYQQIELSNNKKGILVYAYSKRGYGDGITDFLKKIGDQRGTLLNSMISKVLPKIKMDN